MTKTLGEIASHVGAAVVGDATVPVRHIRGLQEAEEGDLTFFTNPRYRSLLERTRASAILVPKGIDVPGKNLVVADDPYVAFARLLNLFYPEKRPAPGIRVGAWISPGARIQEGATVYPGAYVGERARIGAGTVLYPGVFVGDEAEIGEESVLYPNVSVYRRCRIGNRVILHAGVVVGSDGFGFAGPGRENLKVPQTGIVQIDDDVEIGANTTIDRGTLDKTWIKRGVKVDNLVQIAHNVIIDEYSIVVAQVGISGSSKLGKGVILGGQVGVVGHIEIGDHAMVAAKTGIHKAVPAGRIVSGYVQMPHQEWLKTVACFPKLPEMRKTLTSLRKRIGELEEKLDSLRKEKRS
ncbi:MAG TPA: UDP-3-O-(3-hydroxymyristoyl)glucosamine N-acyltransferase [Syntrophales bacterium]|nr:UDP-3-O-(3-hydroxymyristoyl)glucosamine N-acyltransferase [Syntrophales bacterium]HQB30120.1 UDP-3-O-(3-hydroxymyristoyl)glucosamine N-acyltransferase [Syntrophales bacterium]